MIAKLNENEFRPFDEALRPLLADYLAGKSYLGSDYSYYAFVQWFDEGEYLDAGDALYLRAHMDGRQRHLRRLLYLYPP